ncbi:membrane transporter [Zalerion maritima]|uniref:Membrane transporter n=1 Tax=Zalerion maritima TaxID=339359 RepID=A0AAD5RZ79_9PEZI|nr:membrane transporter [Zalerion maritima]
MGFSITTPTSFRLNMESVATASANMTTQAHESHPDLGHLILLVFEAVMEVVCVSLPGYIIARLGHFDADKQKFLANLNVMLFTPCLIFTKLASQLNADKLAELAVIPIIFVIQTMVSFCVAKGVAKTFGFGRRASNFVTAMGVFGNSNSLPISLVLSLSQTLSGLHWDKVPGDTDDEVAARGILYLLIFQQLGQAVRWSWGYHVLLAPKSAYPEYNEQIAEEGEYRDEPEERTIGSPEPQREGVLIEGIETDTETSQEYDSEQFEPAGRTPIAGTSRASPADSEDEGSDAPKKSKSKSTTLEAFPDMHASNSSENMLSFPRIQNEESFSAFENSRGSLARALVSLTKAKTAVCETSSKVAGSIWCRIPSPIRTVISKVVGAFMRVFNNLAEFMNPPLWAMLIAITVASVPQLQRAFFEEGSFVKNSVTSAVKSSAGVAVPLILVVLGANLARNTESHPDDDHHDPEEQRIGKKLLIASLLSRMVLPTLIMAPILALFAKFVPVSILDDPIFVIVCFLLTGAPSALQLAQICQINEVFENVMAKILFQSYVIWILPSTLMLVMLALEVVEWAAV